MSETTKELITLGPRIKLALAATADAKLLSDAEYAGIGDIPAAAAAASSAASEASDHKGDAETAATAASAAASTATIAAGVSTDAATAASGFAVAAEASKDAAETSQSAAEEARDEAVDAADDAIGATLLQVAEGDDDEPGETFTGASRTIKGSDLNKRILMDAATDQEVVFVKRGVGGFDFPVNGVLCIQRLGDGEVDAVASGDVEFRRDDLVRAPGKGLMIFAVLDGEFVGKDVWTLIGAVEIPE